MMGDKMMEGTTTMERMMMMKGNTMMDRDTIGEVIMAMMALDEG